MTRIVVDALSARAGGGRTYVRYLTQVPPPEGVQVIVLLSEGVDAGGLPRGITVERVKSSMAKPLFRGPWSNTVLPSLVRRLDADVLFSPGGTLPVRAVHCPTATMFRNMLPFQREQRQQYPLGYKRWRLRALQGLLLRSMARADLVIFVSRHAQELIDSLAPGQVRRSVVIPHGVAPAFRASHSSRPSWFPAGDHLVYVSNLEPYKCQIEVVRAFARLLLQRREPRRLILVGAATSRHYARQVSREIARLGLSDKVMLRGHVAHDELADIFAQAHVGIFASICENCPNTLLEAMAAGRPLAVARHAPLPEFAGDAVAYFEPGDDESIADTLALLLDDRELREDLGTRAAERAEAFDWDETGRRTWTALRDVAMHPATTQR